MRISFHVRNKFSCRFNPPEEFAPFELAEGLYYNNALETGSSLNNSDFNLASYFKDSCHNVLDLLQELLQWKLQLSLGKTTLCWQHPTYQRSSRPHKRPMKARLSSSSIKSKEVNGFISRPAMRCLEKMMVFQRGSSYLRLC